MRIAVDVGGALVTAGSEVFPVHTDARGTLLAVEGIDVGFPIRRVFTVTGTAGSVPRGGHAPGCRELLVLVTGRVSGSVRRPAGVDPFDLGCSGASVRVEPADRIDYALDAGSVLMVLCDRPYEEVS